MNIISVFDKIPFSYQVKTALLFLWRFGVGKHQLSLLYKYISPSLFSENNDTIHLVAAMNWLKHAQDFDEIDKGVSCVFYLQTGWGVSYPETSGYILATYLAYADFSNDQQYIERAIEIADWEIKIQAPNGGVYSNPTPGNIAAFNTGQVILGWCSIYEHTGKQKYLDAAVRAGNYLKLSQDLDGNWIKGSYSGARTYEARVDWALLKLTKLTGNDAYRYVAIKNLNWILLQQKENGWFMNCGFKDSQPIMHVIIYTLRGLLECELIEDNMVKDMGLMEIVIKTVNKLCEVANQQFVHGIKGMMPRAFNEKWEGLMTDSCLTGNAQFVILLYRISHVVKDNLLYLKTANLILSSLKKTQLIDTDLKDIRGALPGTFPIYRGYLHDAYPNWGTKFFADALLMKIEYEQRLVISA